jgi:hypothetical protein
MAKSGIALSRIFAASTIVSAFVAITISATGRGDTTEQTQVEPYESVLGRQDVQDLFSQEAPLLIGEPSLEVQQKNALSSQARSEKADLLEPVEIGSAEYRTVETRTNRSSILTRIKIED